MSPRLIRRLPYRINKGPCNFCTSRTEPDYKEAARFAPYISERGKIYPKLRTGVCAKHQRRLTKAIKRARHLGLIAFTAGISTE